MSSCRRWRAPRVCAPASRRRGRASAGASRPGAERLQGEPVEPEVAPAALVAGADARTRSTANCRSVRSVVVPPGEIDLPPLDAHLLPVAGEREVRAAEPPDVVAGRIDELDFEVVAPRLAAHPERDLVVIGQTRRQTRASPQHSRRYSRDRTRARARRAFDAAWRSWTDALTPSEASDFHARDIVHLVEVADRRAAAVAAQ